MNLLYDGCPGELVDEPSIFDMLPDIGGCGSLLWLVTTFSMDGESDAIEHMQQCKQCRAALVSLGTIASGIDALEYFERTDEESVHTETSYAERLGGEAA